MRGRKVYLAPEGPGTPQADIYSLGKLSIRNQHRLRPEGIPALPPDMATRADRDALVKLNAIVMCACQFDPRERRADAGAIQAELGIVAMRALGPERTQVA